MAEVRFPQCLPIKVPESVNYSVLKYSLCDIKLQEIFGHSISGMSSFLYIFEKGIPYCEKLLDSVTSRIEKKIDKRFISPISSIVTKATTIIVTVVILPKLCALGFFYNMGSGCIKMGFGVSNYFDLKNEEKDAAEKEQAHVECKKGEKELKYELLFKEATQHFCLAGIDLMRNSIELTLVFAGAFSLDRSKVKACFKEIEQVILNGEAYNTLKEWTHELNKHIVELAKT